MSALRVGASKITQRKTETETGRQISTRTQYGRGRERETETANGKTNVALLDSCSVDVCRLPLPDIATLRGCGTGCATASLSWSWSSSSPTRTAAVEGLGGRCIGSSARPAARSLMRSCTAMRSMLDRVGLSLPAAASSGPEPRPPRPSPPRLLTTPAPPGSVSSSEDEEETEEELGISGRCVNVARRPAGRRRPGAKAQSTRHTAGMAHHGAGGTVPARG
jgi:hypothetical protein